MGFAIIFKKRMYYFFSATLNRSNRLPVGWFIKEWFKFFSNGEKTFFCLFLPFLPRHTWNYSPPPPPPPPSQDMADLTNMDGDSQPHTIISAPGNLLCGLLRHRLPDIETIKSPPREETEDTASEWPSSV